MTIYRPQRQYLAKISLLLCILLAVSACAATRQTTSVTGDAARMSDSLTTVAREAARLRKELDGKNETILQLTSDLQTQTELSGYFEAELDRTREVLEYAEKQFISLERGLQSHETKASAVAALAEAKLAYDKALRDDNKAKELANVQQAKEKIQKGDELLSRNRYAASVYFSTRALRLLQESPKNQTIRIVSVEQANVRSGPGMGYGVVEKLALGTVLIQLEDATPWFKVETRSGDAVWIHQSVTVSR